MNALFGFDPDANHHALIDFIRDVLGTVVAGLLITWFARHRAARRSLARGLNRCWTEIRHTQKSVAPPVEPFYQSSRDIDSLTEEE